MTIKNKKRFARISGIAGISLGVGMFFLFKNTDGWIPFVLGLILFLWSVIKK